DNLWSDQSLETDPDLPPGWRKIHDSLGTYYWHVPTGTTQWQHPAHTTGPGGRPEADGEETFQGMHSAKDRPIPSPMASLSRRTSLPWHGEDFQHSAEPGSKCFAVRSLGWVEIPEEDLAPGKSSIAVNNCIQQLSNSKGQGSAENRGEVRAWDSTARQGPAPGPLLLSVPPILNIRVWGVGCNNGRGQLFRDFAFVASDKDTCILKCHVFHCNVPAKGIAKALHEMCSKVGCRGPGGSGHGPGVSGQHPACARPGPGAGHEGMMGWDGVSHSPGMDVLNEAIEKLTRGPGREHWMPSLIRVSDTAMRVHPAQEDEEAAHIWECQVRYVTFLGAGRDAHTFA
ncbi:Amyloid beta A4 precursor protein-binding family B member 3, partial [Egretta garzetta]